MINKITMGLYLINIDIADSDVINKIQNMFSWARINFNTFCVKDNKMDTERIRDFIRSISNKNYKVFVVEITDSAWASWNLPKEVTKWIKDAQ